MKPLRLAFIAPRLPSGESVGGAETLIKHHAVLASGMGHDVTFLTTCAVDHFSWKNDMAPGRRIVNGLEVEMFPVDENRDLEAFLSVQERIMRGHTVSEEEEKAWLNNGITSSAMITHLRSKDAGYDIVIAGPYLFGLTVSALRETPSRSILLPCLHDEPFARLKVFRRLFGEVDGVIFNTAPERDFAVSIAGGELPANDIVGFSIPSFRADGARFRISLPFEGDYVLYSGRREPMKGTPLLLDYLRVFRKRTGKNISLVLTGKGQVDKEDGDGTWVFDAGFLSEENKFSAMAGSVAFCHPSTFESLGIVLLESWMSGAPCLVHAGSKVLTDQCRRSNGGLWFRCYPDFEEELMLLLDNPGVRTAMAERGRAYVEKEYSREAVGIRLGAVLARVAGI